jgi:NAD-dependent DNA ligase
VIPAIIGLVDDRSAAAGTTEFVDPAADTSRFVCDCARRTRLSIVEGASDQATNSGNMEVVCCAAPDCTSKALRALEHFAKTLEIRSLSEATIGTLVNEGFLDARSFASVFELPKRRDQLVQLRGWGAKRTDALIQSIETQQAKASLATILIAFGIPKLGASTIAKVCATATRSNPNNNNNN